MAQTALTGDQHLVQIGSIPTWTDHQFKISLPGATVDKFSLCLTLALTSALTNSQLAIAPLRCVGNVEPGLASSAFALHVSNRLSENEMELIWWAVSGCTAKNNQTLNAS
jgi:hypothetical protein